MKKVIFLDFDGVIVTRKSKYTDLDMDCFNLLKHIIELTGADVVISSSWRVLHKLNFLKKFLRNEINVVGITPSLVTPSLILSGRGAEIQQYLDEHKDIEKFVIIDDDVYDMGEELMPYVVHTDVKIGLTKENAKQAIEILNKDN